MAPHKPLLSPPAIALLAAAFLMAFEMEQSSHRYPTEKHEGAVQKSSFRFVEAVQLEE
jgi:hypothetical protein